MHMNHNLRLERSVAPQVLPLPAPVLPDFDTYTLPNGSSLTVLRRGCDAGVFRICAVCKTDVAFPAGPAVSQLYMPMLREGTSSLLSADISDILDGTGSWLNGFTSSHHFVHQLFGLHSGARPALEVFADILRNPVFPADSLAVVSESEAQKAEVAMHRVATHARRAVEKIVWGSDHPSVQVPSPDGLRSITPDSLTALHRRIYRPSDFRFYLSGNITPDIEKIVSETVGSDLSPLPDTPSDPVVITPLPPRPSCGDTFTRVSVPDSRQAAIRLDIPSIGRDHPDYEMLRLAITALGGYFGSRLMTNLREDKGLTYGISAGLLGSIDGGVISVSTECRADAANQAIDEIRAEITRMATEPLSDEEIHRLCSFAMSRQASTLDSPFTIADVAMYHTTLGTPPDYFERTNRAILTATPRILADLAARYLDLSRAATVLAAP